MTTNSTQVKDAAVVGVLALIAWQVYRFFNPADPDPGSGPAGEVDAAEEDNRPATFTDAQAVGLADSLLSAFYGFTEDEGAIVDILTMCETTADVRLLVNAFGDRALLCAWFDNRVLNEAVRLYLSDDDIAIVNDRYLVRDIKYRF